MAVAAVMPIRRFGAGAPGSPEDVPGDVPEDSARRVEYADSGTACVLVRLSGHYL
jgi:hypothetical protein